MVCWEGTKLNLYSVHHPERKETWISSFNSATNSSMTSRQITLSYWAWYFSSEKTWNRWFLKLFLILTVQNGMIKLQVWQVKSCNNTELFPYHYSQITYVSHYSELLWSCSNFSAPQRTICLSGFYKNIRKNKNHSQAKAKIGDRESLISRCC